MSGDSPDASLFSLCMAKKLDSPLLFAGKKWYTKAYFLYDGKFRRSGAGSAVRAEGENRMHAKPGKIIITLLLFLVACSLLLAAFVNYAGYTRRSREEDAFRELEQSAAVGAQMMDTSLREMRGVTDTLATTLSRLEFADTDDMRGYLSRCALDNGLAWLIYQESGGDPVSSDGAVHDLPEEVTQWASGISSPYVDGAAGNAVVTFYQTVQQDGEALGRLYVASYAEDISRGFPLQVYGGVGYAYVVDGEGNWVLPVTYSGGHEINDNFIVYSDIM